MRQFVHGAAHLLAGNVFVIHLKRVANNDTIRNNNSNEVNHAPHSHASRLTATKSARHSTPMQHKQARTATHSRITTITIIVVVVVNLHLVINSVITHSHSLTLNGFIIVRTTKTPEPERSATHRNRYILIRPPTHRSATHAHQLHGSQ